MQYFKQIEKSIRTYRLKTFISTNCNYKIQWKAQP